MYEKSYIFWQNGLSLEAYTRQIRDPYFHEQANMAEPPVWDIPQVYLLYPVTPENFRTIYGPPVRKGLFSDVFKKFFGP